MEVMQEEPHDHDRGLAFDLSTLIARRRLFTLFAGAGLAAVVAGCGSSGKSSATSATSAAASPTTPATNAAVASTTAATTATSGTAAATAATTPATAAPASGNLQTVPEETAGPYPGDGSNGVDVLTKSGIVRSDIRSSFGTSSTVAKGVPTTIKLTLVNSATGAPMPGAAVYIWHCDANGLYSLYSQGATAENYLRGVQAADANGVVTFASIYPACYAGRWPHIHFEVYPSIADATTAANLLATSQLALTAEVSAAVYATGGYPNSTSNLSRVSLATDMVFSDGVELETPTITGNVTDGYVIAMSAAISA